MSFPSSSSIFVPAGLLFTEFAHLDLTLLDCSIYARYAGRNSYKLEFFIEKYETTFPRFNNKYINTYVASDYSFMVGKKFTKHDLK